MKKPMSILVVIALFFASAFTPKPQPTAKVEADIVDLAVQTEFLSTLVAA
ncbi:MAG: fasciclin, partial [Algoriphagus sp. 32-45-6]